MLPIIQTFQSNFVSVYRKQYNANHTVHIILLLPRNFFFSSSILDILVHTNKSNRELEKKRFSTIIQQYVLFSWIYQKFLIAYGYGFSQDFLTFLYSYLKHRKQSVNINDTHWENYVSLNSAQKLIEIESWLLLIFFLRLYNQVISIHSTATYI